METFNSAQKSTLLSLMIALLFFCNTVAADQAPVKDTLMNETMKSVLTEAKKGMSKETKSNIIITSIFAVLLGSGIMFIVKQTSTKKPSKKRS